MKDLNSVNKYVCNSCSNPQARLCYECKLEIIDNAYKN